MSEPTTQCEACKGVLPATDRRQFTSARARLIVEHGYCQCQHTIEEAEAASAPHKTPQKTEQQQEGGPARNGVPTPALHGRS
ncbi:hypothetical protein [Planobispora takensis]|uniref:Uncharacterized protein n=1 Tax=Planobispora takensis TaxID=1367882 RepID=A0A8J3WTH0_9ACTN|nr:hypothetical protein [Planobispora takensis]GII01511.1 hypothetical protein Pta02_35190 [Planobispora takensis]